ncbi:hypothetical protein D5041_10555 [Verminephrobacter aporrectodeae subsp. tuberculatae]|uniref:hypothetical protein n=1 Tax=Verminephrobacter aporrectodeae TaxID=1110389 RepID=UPI002237FF1B|nr:hypothetical protein [Verminephrobacter aporrectodeae]MCW5220192.1 hypothetical protein [Verminephrobacter aporrectodeae subsp. tuberculatae]MCW5289480.1 hypothetical protein [Verminephrobacter aporrectodeae subsp. tuberculatae]
MLRDRINTDTRYVRYKTLVGFKSVLPPQWEDRNFDDHEGYRRKEYLEYIAAISMENSDEWYDLIIRCAETGSNEVEVLASLIFCDFLCELAREKPDIVLAWRKSNNKHLLDFLLPVLNGLFNSSAIAEYKSLIASYLEKGEYLLAIARHFQVLESPPVEQAKMLLDKALANDDRPVISESIALAIKKHASSSGWIEEIFLPALQHLISAKDCRWIGQNGYIKGIETFVAQLSPDQISVVLEGILAAPEIEYEAEHFLALIATRDLKAVLDFFHQRLANKQEIKDYQAIPYSFDWLKKPFSENIDLIIDTIRKWDSPSDQFFRFTYGRLLRAALPTFTEEGSTKFMGIAETGLDQDINFILSAMPIYCGNPLIFPVLMAVVNRLSPEDARLKKVEDCILPSGMITGRIDYAYADAYRAKKKELQKHYPNDPRPRVKDFVEKCLQQLDRHIASEQRSADQQSAQRRLGLDE